RAGPNRLSTTTAGPDPRKQNLIGNTHRLDTEDHFRTDVSHLPDLTAYLDDLLQTRERLAAAIDGADERARADATPADQEITRIRALIARINGDIAQLTDAERAQIDQAVTVVRRHRAVSLGMPAIRPAAAAATVTR
ncbi:MAG: hypothetical protein ACRDOL_32205, partial [Streptosporangiaceae bacterium]